MVSLRERMVVLAKAQEELRKRDERARQRESLFAFVEYFWNVLEPNKPLVDGLVMRAICLHLEAVSKGKIRRLLINVPPGFSKSLLTNVFWPAWQWSAFGAPGTRYVTFSYASHLTERDNAKFRDVIRSRQFQELWGETVSLTEDGKVKVANNKTGWKFASSVRGVGTGERGEVVILDDPMNVKEGESEAVRSETVRWVREGMSNRLNDMETGAIVIIMQRVHEDDVSGAVISDDLGYVHLCVPIEYDPGRHCRTPIWEDWRTEEGELAWPERFPRRIVNELKKTLGPYAYAGQYQQSPEPRGGGIFKRDWWKLYELDDRGRPKFPPHYVIASLDPAYTAKQENDPSGFVIYGVFKDRDGRNKVVLLYAWQKRLELHGVDVERKANETESAYINRSKPHWGLVEQVAHDCKRMKADLLLIEAKASGLSVAQEIRRLYRDEPWGVQTIDPKSLDKRARALSVQHLFADGMIFSPDRDWADMVISEHAKFRGVHSDEDNLVDASTQALRYLRDTGIAVRRDEYAADERDAAQHRRPLAPLYEV